MSACKTSDTLTLARKFPALTPFPTPLHTTEPTLCCHPMMKLRTHLQTRLQSAHLHSLVRCIDLRFFHDHSMPATRPQPTTARSVTAPKRPRSLPRQRVTWIPPLAATSRFSITVTARPGSGTGAYSQRTATCGMTSAPRRRGRTRTEIGECLNKWNCRGFTTGR